MSELHHFTHGPLTLVLAYSASVLGVLFGLICAARARVVPARWAKALWLGLAAVAIGGTGIWVMHFIALFGVGVDALEIRYDVDTTLFSALIAVAATGAGLALAVLRSRWRPSLVVGGVIMGTGAASMHYIGMAAMRMPAHYHYEPLPVVVSIAIALTGSTAVLWACVNLRGLWPGLGFAALSGAALTAMHYTGMAALRLHGHLHMEEPQGARTMEILPPFVVGIVVISIALLGIILVTPTQEELIDEAESRRRAVRRAGPL